jgi:Holliday junction resolvasome RuvABC endonuclease subunit
MKLQDLKDIPKADLVLGVDASTKSYAWCLLDGAKVVSMGEEVFEGKSMYEKMKEAEKAAQRLAKMAPEFCALEQAVFVNNRAVTIKLSYFYGILMGAMAANDIPFDDVPPMTWMNHIGNARFTKQEQMDFRKLHPKRTKNWYKDQMRKIRKQRTIDWVVDRYSLTPENDNIADAVGVATYAREVLTNG